MKYTMVFPEVPPNNNAYIRMHWTVRKPVLDKWILNVKQQRNEMDCSPLPKLRFPRDPLTAVGIVWRLKVHRLRDWDNAAGMFKAVGDALRLSGIIKNDSPLVVKWFRVEQVPVKRKRGEDPHESCEVELWTEGDL